MGQNRLYQLLSFFYIVTIVILGVELWKRNSNVQLTRSEINQKNGLTGLLTMPEIKVVTKIIQYKNISGTLFEIVEVESEKMLSVLVKPGTETYYTLKSVKQQLIREVQLANEELLFAMNKISNRLSLETKNITRAILAYLPLNMDGYMKQLKSLYLSLAIMRLSQSENIKTDLIIFTPKDGFEYPMSLGCVKEARTSFEDSERCTVVEHLPMATRPFLEDGAIDPLIKYAAYIDSILIVAEFPFTSIYDFILRADLDTFLTPGFGDWVLPHKASIAVGEGGYGSTNANAHLTWVSVSRLGLKDAGLTNLGATWYGGSEITVAAAKITVKIMRWLQTQEFNEFEICCSGVNGWPHWHWPVTMLYGMHIAVNQIQPENVIQSKSGTAIMDFYSTSTVPLDNTIKQIHCWHTEELFSKFALLDGRYRNLNLSEYQNMTTPRDYSTMIAVSSERLSVEEVKEFTSNPTLMKERRWMRTEPQ